MKPASLGLAMLLSWGLLVPRALATDISAAPLATQSFNPWFASGLSLAFSGAGQLYKGETPKALWMATPTLIFPLAWLLDSLMDTPYCRLGSYALMGVAKGISVWDAYVATPSLEPVH